METFSPTSALSSVDLPTFGRPTSAAKPARKAAVGWSDMQAQCLQRGLRGCLLGAAAAWTRAFGLDARMLHVAGDQESLGVRLAGGLFDRVHGQLPALRLQMLLQAGLGSLERGRLGQRTDARLEHGRDTRPHGVESAVQVQGAAQCLEGIGQDGLAPESAGLELART